MEFIPALLGVGSDDIDHEFRRLLALSVKSGGLGIRNPMATAEELFDVSHAACSHLIGTLVHRSELDIVRHGTTVGEAIAANRKARVLEEGTFLERRGRGKPATKRRQRKNMSGTGTYLQAIPDRLNGTILSANEWRDNTRIRFNLEPLDMPRRCDGCGECMTVEHALQCKRGGLVSIRHDDLGSEWRWLTSCATSHARVSREPRIHSSASRTERDVAAAENRAPVTTPTPQSTPDPDEKRADVGVHGFWQNGRPCLFDIRVTDTDARSYRHKEPAQVLADQEQEKKDKYLATCHELRKDFTPLVYSVDGMAGREAKAAERRCASMLAKKWHLQYSQMVHFVRVRMALAVARSNSLLIRGSRAREPNRPFIQSRTALYEPQTWQER